MFDPPRARRAAGDADGRRSVLVGPAGADGGVRARHDPVVGRPVRREDQGGGTHPVQAARHRMAQQVRALGPAIVEDVAPVLVQHREMHVHPVARILGEGFGHEGRRHAVAAGQSAHQRLEEDHVVGRGHRIAMREVDFELAQPGLGDRAFGGDVHRLAGGVELGEIGVERVELADRQDRVPAQRPARDGVFRRGKRPARIVDEVEFHLGRRLDPPAARGIAFQHGRQCVARIAQEGLARLVMHPHWHQGRVAVEPGHRHRPALGRVKYAVLVPGLEDQGAVLDVGAPDIDVEHRKRHPHRALRKLVVLAGGQALAAHLSVEVAGSDAEGRIAFEFHAGLLVDFRSLQIGRAGRRKARRPVTTRRAVTWLSRKTGKAAARANGGWT